MSKEIIHQHDEDIARKYAQAHADLLTIHAIGLCVAECPPIEESDSLTVKYVKGMAQQIQMLERHLEAARHFNQLTPAQLERLALLIEEMGEAQQTIGKVLRHGYESGHPDGSTTNREDLEYELGHVRHAMIRLCDAGDLDKQRIHDCADIKAKTVSKYLHHSA